MILRGSYVLALDAVRARREELAPERGRRPQEPVQGVVLPAIQGSGFGSWTESG